MIAMGKMGYRVETATVPEPGEVRRKLAIRLLDTYSESEVAGIFGVGRSTVRYWRDSEGARLSPCADDTGSSGGVDGRAAG